MTKFIFVMGGVMSGVGKGVAVSSLGVVLQSRGFNVTAVKIDPYINVDAGTMNPVEHGEVFVTKDGVECDQDIGNYERFLHKDLSKLNYMTTGSVYLSVIQRERNLEYGGKSVEVVPHIPLEVIDRLKKVAKQDNYDFVLVEIGGTVGEYQNMLFLEAARMLHLQDPKSVLFVLVSYVPIPKMVGEMKTKPTQYAVRTLNSAGIQPDIIIARSEVPLDKPRKEKIATFCNIQQHAIISAPDIAGSIYEIPLNFEKEHLAKTILNFFNLKDKKSNLSEWEQLVEKIHNGHNEINIGIVGKYFETGKFILADSYISVIEAIRHAAWHNNLKANIEWLNAEEYEKDPSALKSLKNYNGIIVPGGFGKRGIEGKIAVARYCRENNIPYLGLCYGMQIAVIEIARNLCNLKDANTTEIDENTQHPVVDVMENQKENLRLHKYGGSMRLGAYECAIKQGSVSSKAYKQETVQERHRHRYEINNAYIPQLQEQGCVIAGTNPKTDLVEIIEVKDHPFFVGTQFHPELQSRFKQPHPLFLEFIQVARG